MSASGAFVSAANDGFVDSLSIGLRIAAAIIVFAAVMAWRYLPVARRRITVESLQTTERHDPGRNAMTVVAGD